MSISIQPHLHLFSSFIGMTPRAGNNFPFASVLPSMWSFHNCSETVSLRIHGRPFSLPLASFLPDSISCPNALLLPSNISLNLTLSWPPCSWFTSVWSKGRFTNVVAIYFLFLPLSYFKLCLACRAYPYHLISLTFLLFVFLTPLYSYPTTRLGLANTRQTSETRKGGCAYASPSS